MLITKDEMYLFISGAFTKGYKLVYDGRIRTFDPSDPFTPVHVGPLAMYRPESPKEKAGLFRFFQTKVHVEYNYKEDMLLPFLTNWMEMFGHGFDQLNHATEIDMYKQD